jgi:ABC-2 type transport system permease protein
MTAAELLSPVPNAQPAPLWRMVAAQAQMELRLSLRRGESLLVTVLIPVLLLVFFGAVPAMQVGSTRPVDFLLPGILALAVMSTGLVSLGIATAFERQYGVLKRLGGSPLSRPGLLAAKLLSVLLVVALQVVLLSAVGRLLFGWSLGGSPLLAFLVLLLGTFVFAGIGLLLAGALRAEAVLAVANGLYLLFLLLGDMVIPLSALPGWLTAVTSWLPAAAFAEALRAAINGGQVSLRGVIVLCLWGGLALTLAARTFRWE